MSEKSKGDTSSSSTIPAPSRVVKNPLLSASVTGLTFEDFPNKPLLLPAAPPVVHVAPIAPPVLSLGIMNREPKSLVTVGQNSNIDRDESLSEINLNSNADDSQPPSAQFDSNSNSLLEQNTNTDSILSQAASSFSALPSVASSVFSTFSKRIYSTTSSRERTPVSEERDVNANPISELDIQPAYTQHPQPQQKQQQQHNFYTAPPLQFGASTESSSLEFVPTSLPVANTNLGGPPTTFGGPPPAPSTQTQYLNQELPPEPPKFYTPAEVPNLSAASVAAPPSTGGQNTYRLTAKKKIYAPIPGFSEATNQQHQVAPILDPSAISAPITAQTQPNPYGYQQPTDLYGHDQNPAKLEERKGGLFSISNLVPTGVLQNISGLVQSAAGTIAQTVAPDSQYQSSITSQQQQAQTSFDINFQPPTSNVASLNTNFYPTPQSQNVSTAPYPSDAQQIQVGLPALPPQSNFFAPSVSQNPTESPIGPVSTQLGFDQFLSDSTSASSQIKLKPTEKTVEEPKSEDSNTLKTTENPVRQAFDNSSESTQSAATDSSAIPPTLATPSPVSTLPKTELFAASEVPAVAVAPAQIPFYDPIRPPTQPVSAASIDLFSNSTSFPIRPPTQPAPNIFSAPIRPPTQPASNIFSAPIRPPTQPTPNIFSAPIRPPTQPTPNIFSAPIRPPSQPIPAATNNSASSGFFDPIRPPSQPISTVSSVLPPEGFSAPIRPPSQPNSAATTLSTPNIFSAPIRPPSQPLSATNLTLNTFEPISPASQQASVSTGSSTPVGLSAPIRPPTQPVSAATYNSTPANFFAPIRPPTQPFFDPIRPPTQPTGSANFAPSIFSAPIRPPTQPTTVAATPINFFDPTRPPSQTAASDLTPQIPQSITQQTSQIPSAPITNNIYQASALPAQVPPTSIGQPPASSGPSSFRLQKGTRLYKNPLTSAETVPATHFASALQQPSFVEPPTVAPQSIFNPFASTVAAVEQSPALFVPETLPAKELKVDPGVNTQASNQFVPEKLLSEALKEAPKPEPSQPIGFFDPNSTVTSELKHQATFLPNTELELKSTDQQTSIPNIQEIKLPLPSDLFLSQEAQSALETESTNATSSLFDANVNSEVANVNVNESQSQPEKNPTDNQEKPHTTEEREEDNLALCKPQQEQLKQTNDDSLAALQGANFLPPPPQLTAVQGSANPYRKDHPATHTATGTQPSLANFFTPIESDTSTDFNFFSTPTQSTQSSSTATVFSEPEKISENSTSTVSNFFQLQTPNAPTPSPQPTPSASPATTSTSAQASGSVNSNTVPALFPQLPPQTIVAPPPLFKEPPKDFIDSTSAQQPTIAPPLGFDNLIASIDSNSTSNVGNATKLQSQESTTQQPLNFHSVTNFFNQSSNLSNFESTVVATAKETEREVPNPTSFFDTFSAVSNQSALSSSTNLVSPTKQQQTNEDQRIQNFFNNPPPQELGGSVGDLNYDLVHGGLAVKNLQTRSLTPASILVEPPSSSCSEFSELNSSLLGQQRQNVSAINTNKNSAEEESKSQAAVETVNAVTSENASEEETVEDLSKHYKDLPEEVLEVIRMANLLTGEKGAAIAPPATISAYAPAVKHWFYKRENCNKIYWTPFSHYDSALLETAHVVSDNSSNIVAVEGGRFDVNIQERIKTPVYWEGKSIEVRRCSWFYKGTDSRYVPYEEETAERLEAEYKLATEKDEWHKKIIVSMGEQVVFHGPTVIVHFQQQQSIDAWGGSSQTTTRPRVVKRDLEDFTIEQGESQHVDHLLLMVHGIGSVCDLKMRPVEEVVDDFRSIAQQLVSSHYKNSTDMGMVGRVEILPISWHSHLHSAEMGIDEKLKSITLESIPKLRNFANDTLLDVLFYTSPRYCQKIMNTVATSMNAVYVKYRQRNPDFNGGVSVAGHSLGSLILFDMLCHQKPIKEFEEENMENPDQQFPAVPSTYLSSMSSDDAAKDASYTTGIAGTGQPFIHYEQLLFHPKKFFAIGSPIGVFVTIRGIDKLGLDFRLPTCPGFYNIFHPFDPIAYRIEALINPDMAGIRPVLISHHKGRKRMHLELRETMTRVGADLKQRFMDTFKNTLDSVNFLGSPTALRGSSKENEIKETMAKEVDKVLKMQSDMERTDEDQLMTDEQKMQPQPRQRTDSASTSFSDTDMVEIDFPLGKLNDSKRIDYVLQEAPLEFFNEYLFALSSHVGYWESEDTILFVMKEIYSGLGVSPDSQVPQQSMTIERPSSQNNQHDQVTTPT